MAEALCWGTSYYPELIDEAEWPQDLDAMQAAGVRVLRILDFAWTAIEPQEGVHAWGWLDRFIEQAASRGLRLILCTPTATPPAWLARQYPEIMLADERKQPRPWGNRREADVDSEIYRHFCAGIARALGERYGGHPAVIGWQLDNELVGSEIMAPECHSRASQWRFRDYLKRRYGSVAELNRAWGMRFWNQDFSCWGEIETPHHGRPCQGHSLDYARYFSESQRDFLRVQAEVLRPLIAPTQWISHNATALFDRGLDHRCYAEALDVTGWDAYLGAAAGRAKRYRPAFAALAHDWMRSIKRQPFWVFETNPFTPDAPDCFYAEMVARGAAGIVVWHWRTHRQHVEQASETMADFAGRVHPERVERLQRLAACPELASVAADVGKRRRAAILFSVDEVRAENRPNPYRTEIPTRYLHALGAMVQAAWRLGLACDVLEPGDPLDGYALVIAPSLEHLDAAQARLIEGYVASGGVLAACAKTAHRDRHGGFHNDLGGPLAGLLGFTQRVPCRVTGEQRLRWSDGEIQSAWDHLEHVAEVEGEVRARFEGGALDGAVAAFRRSHGRGRLHYLATCGEACAWRLLREAAQDAGLPLLLHQQSELGVLPSADGSAVWLFNYAREPVSVGSLTLPPGGWARSAPEALGAAWQPALAANAPS